MTNEEILKKRRIAFKIALRFVGNEQDAEEIASDVLEIILVKRPTTCIIKRIVIDAIRKKFGRSSDKSHEQRQKVYHAMDWWANNLADIQSSKSLLEDFEKESLFRKAQDILDPIESCILSLLVRYGFTNQEIADCFGFTQTWV